MIASKLNATLPYRVLRRIITLHPMFRFVRETRGTQTPISFECWFRQRIIGINRGPYWPVDPSSRVVEWPNICIGVETSPGQMPGCYIQGIGRITIGDYTQIASNVGIISANHDLYDCRLHFPEEVNIGSYCWLGMGSVILPGVSLGDFTIVGANSVVTKSFKEGHCVVAGTPARIVKELDKDLCIRHKSQFEYHGYIPKVEFDAFRKRHLRV